MELLALIGALSDPRSYPHRPRKVTVIQTHISVVFIADDLVYKVKKPVDFGFLDFTTLEKRKDSCEQETALNRRLCPDIYLGVAPITKRDGGVTVGGTGAALEYAVVMKRMPKNRMMDVLLGEGKVDRRAITRIAQTLVPFYRGARTGPGVDRYGTIGVIGLNCDENFNQTRKYIGKTVSPEFFQTVKDFTEHVFREKEELFSRRVAGTFIREGHGDLHSRNICITPKDVYIYDCIEFNERFRMGDVAQDVAFLSMDLDFFRYGGLSRFFIDEYVRLSGDTELRQLVDFYACYHAFTRGKVLSFELGEAEIDSGEREEAARRARSYFHLAHHYAVKETTPFLVITFGLAGTGKSRIADLVAHEIDAAVFRSDEVRKELSGTSPLEHRYGRFGVGIYSTQMTEKTYKALLDRARETLCANRSVILDACFLKRDERKEAARLAEETGARFFIAAVTAPDDVVKKRIARRMKEKDASDATFAVYQRQKLLRERLDPAEERCAVGVDTTGPENENARSIVGRLLLGEGV
jgi:aminoglycoside phosphotransferase family enzyme/predicted kinase